MGHFMDDSLDGLYLAQAGLNHDPLFHITAIPLRRAGKRLKYHWQRGQGGQRRNNTLVLRHIAGQFHHAQRGEFLSLGLGNIKHGHDPVCNCLHFDPLHDGLVVRAIYRLVGLRVPFLLLHPSPVGGRG